MQQPLKLAVVGCGYWGPNLLRNFAQLSDCDVVVLCDTNEQRLAEMRQRYPGLETTTDYSEVIQRDEIEAVVLAVPAQLHHPFARQSLAAGKHTFVEKPLALTGAHCEELIGLARKNDLVLFVGHTFLYSAAVRETKSLIDADMLGDVLHVRSSRLNLGLFQNDINVLWDLAPHDLSIILHVLGQEPVAVNCQGRGHVNPDVVDVAVISLEFPGKLMATVQVSWLDPKKVREMTFVGTRRMLVFNDLENVETLKIYDKRVEIPAHYDGFGEFPYAYHYGDVISPYFPKEEPLKLEARHFVECIREGTEPLTGGASGLSVVRILEAADASLARDGASVSLEEAGTRLETAS